MSGHSAQPVEAVDVIRVHTRVGGRKKDSRRLRSVSVHRLTAGAVRRRGADIVYRWKERQRVPSTSCRISSKVEIYLIRGYLKHQDLNTIHKRIGLEILRLSDFIFHRWRSQSSEKGEVGLHRDFLVKRSPTSKKRLSRNSSHIHVILFDHAAILLQIFKQPCVHRTTVATPKTSISEKYFQILCPNLTIRPKPSLI